MFMEMLNIKIVFTRPKSMEISTMNIYYFSYALL